MHDVSITKIAPLIAKLKCNLIQSYIWSQAYFHIMYQGMFGKGIYTPWECHCTLYQRQVIFAIKYLYILVNLASFAPAFDTFPAHTLSK